MSNPVEQAIEAVYASLQNYNENLDAHIATLKAALATAGLKEAVFETSRLAQSNRQGRKMMESYFSKRGVTVSFKSTDAA